MKLRIRITEPFRQTVVLDLHGNEGTAPTLCQLRQQAVTSLGLDEELCKSENVVLSLNGTDPLFGGDSLLTDLGVVSGDLVIFTVLPHGRELAEANNANVCDCESQQSSAASPDDRAEQQSMEVVDDHDSQLMLNDNSHHGISNSQTHDETDTATEHDVAGCSYDNTCDTCPGTSSDVTYSTDQIYTGNAERLSMNQVNQYLKKVMLIRESGSSIEDVPDSLGNVLENVETECTHDVLFLLLHVLMMETGLTLQSVAMVTDDAGQTTSSRIPSDWKTTKCYRLHYDCQNFEHVTFELIGVALSGLMVVHGTVLGNESEKHNLKLKVSEYITMDPTKKEVVKFSNLAKLSREFKDSISYAMLQDATNGCDIVVPSLPSVFHEIKMMILKRLDVKSLMKLSASCKSFHTLSRTPSLWYSLFLKDWGKHKKIGADPNKDWYLLYKEEHRQWIKMKELIFQSRVVVPPMFTSPYVPPFMRPPAWGPPFAIGGDYDRDPAFMLDPTRGGIPRIMRPRFNPIGPMPQNMFQPRNSLSRRPMHRGNMFF